MVAPATRTSAHPTWLWPVGGVVVVALVVAKATDPDGSLGQAAFLTTTLGAAVLTWVGGQRWTGPARFAWRMVAVGLVLSGIGDILARLYPLWVGELPGVSLADVGWIGSYAAIALGLFLLSRAAGGTSRDVEVAIDVALVAVVAVLAMWMIAAGPTLADSGTPLVVRVVWASYPILDAALLAVAVRLLLVRGAGRAGWLLAVGVGCWLVADVAYVLQAGGSYHVALDLAWMVGPVVMGAAAWLPSAGLGENTPLRRVGPVRVALSMLPLLAPALLDMWHHQQHGGEGVPYALHIGATAILMALVFTRTLRFVRTTQALRLEVESNERYYRALAANSADASLVVGRDGQVLRPGNGPRLLGEHAHQLASGDELDQLLNPAEGPHLKAVLGRAAAMPGAVVSAELQLAGNEGRWLSVRAVDLHEDPDVRGIVVNLLDITERKQAEQQIEHQALHDELTGLANRAVLRDRLEHALRRATRSSRSSAVIYLDLDGFKKINDSMGHDAGDRLLRAVAQILADTVRSADTVARLGGDEFAVLIEDSARPRDEAITVAERVLQALSAPINVDDREVTITASMGIALADPDSSVVSLLRNADVAMYRAKANGRSRWVMYEPEMHAQIAERLQLELDLHGALDDDQFRLVYQPVVELDGGQVVGFEALLRWAHPTLGVVAPDRFIPIAEETGLIVPIGRWVLDTACATLARWRSLFPAATGLRISVNVSARQLASDDLLDDVTAALTAAGLEPAALVLEMTETALVNDVVDAAAKLAKLRALGIRLAVDDFGTGYSSLGYLRQFPVDLLKIDRSFIATITDSDSTPAIVTGLLELAATMGLETVAEGVEDDVQHERLRAGHCVYGQGYRFARPLDLDAADVLVAGLGASQRVPTS